MFDVLKKLDWFFLKYWKRYTVAIIALIIASLIGLIPPMLIGQTIDQINYNSLTSERLWQVIGLFAVLIVLHYVISYVWDYTLFWFRNSGEVDAFQADGTFLPYDTYVL